MKLTAHPLAELPSAGADAAAVAPPADQQLILRLRISLVGLLSKGDHLAKTFYALLFERHPAVRRLFPEDMTRQREKLTQMLAWIVSNLDRREQLLPGVRELGKRHAGYGAAAEHYPVVRDTLLEAMSRTGEREWNEQLAEDWRLSIDLIAKMMMAASAGPNGHGVPAATVGPAVHAPGAATSTAPR